jgi:hypothetical protein
MSLKIEKIVKSQMNRIMIYKIFVLNSLTYEYFDVFFVNFRKFVKEMIKICSL